MRMTLNYRNDHTNTAQKIAAIITGVLGALCIFAGADAAESSPHHQTLAITLLGYGWISSIVGIAWYWWCRRTEEQK